MAKPKLCDETKVTKRRRVLVVVNKWWECDPALNAMLHPKARPGALPWPTRLAHPRPRPDPTRPPVLDPAPQPRAVWTLPNTTVELWCISDLLEHLPDAPPCQSSSERKMERLPKAFAGPPAPAFVIAVGTAAHFGDESVNGSVVVGTNVFLHDCHPADDQNPDSAWHAGPFDRVIGSECPPALFEAATRVDTAAVEKRLVRPPLAPVERPTVLADHAHVALGAVNVTDYNEYDVTDRATHAAYLASGSAAPLGSLETTHGLIRLQSDAPFAFVSGVTDRAFMFSTEVTPAEYAQNMIASHNAGVVVAWMLPQLDAALGG